jgi:hypothetical protein
MGYGTRCQAHRFVSITTTTLGFSRSTVFNVYQECSTTQRTSNLLDTTVESIGVNMGQHPYGTLLTSCGVHAPMNWGCSEGRIGCNLILRMCYSCFVHSLYITLLMVFPYTLLFSCFTDRGLKECLYWFRLHWGTLLCLTEERSWNSGWSTWEGSDIYFLVLSQDCWFKDLTHHLHGCLDQAIDFKLTKKLPNQAEMP